ncbi:MAG: restriction endonuclease [Planctomycetota bacterium]|jgi:restriction system protein
MGNNDIEKLAPSKRLAYKTVYTAMQILKEKGGEAPGKEVVSEVANRLTFNDWEKATLEKSGYIRWQSIMHFYSIDCVKAGYLIKRKGVWYLTPEGESALERLGEVEFMEEANRAYKEWSKEHKKILEAETTDEEGSSAGATLDETEQKAMEGLREYIRAKNPYEFQDLVAALLRGMGYYTPFVAPKGKDGGIDVIAYTDPIGVQSPRIKVQIKHRQDTASVKEVRELMGVLQKAGDVGIFVSSGGFSPDAKATARNAQVHLELVDLSRLISLWQEFYSKMVDEDKALLPLTPIYFLAPKE